MTSHQNSRQGIATCLGTGPVQDNVVAGGGGRGTNQHTWRTGRGTRCPHSTPPAVLCQTLCSLQEPPGISHLEIGVGPMLCMETPGPLPLPIPNWLCLFPNRGITAMGHPPILFPCSSPPLDTVYLKTCLYLT